MCACACAQVRSLRRAGEAFVPLTVHCLDAQAYERLSSARADGPMQLVPPPADGVPFGTHGALTKQADAEVWARLCALKCRVIRQALDTHRYVVYTDGDVVYERAGAIAHCVEALAKEAEGAAKAEGMAKAEGAATAEGASGAGGGGGVELLVQNYARDDVVSRLKVAYDRNEFHDPRALRQAERDGGVDSRYGVGTGFMALRSTEATRAAFNIDAASVASGWDDESHLNQRLRDGQVAFRALSLRLFPHFKYWVAHRDGFRKSQADRSCPRNLYTFLVHYNGLARADRRYHMRTDERWLLEDAADAELMTDESAEEDVVV